MWTPMEQARCDTVCVSNKDNSYLHKDLLFGAFFLSTAEDAEHVWERRANIAVLSACTEKSVRCGRLSERAIQAALQI